jgi:hypothetical protein
MAGLRLFDVHREWEDWFGMLLGVVIGTSPWLVAEIFGQAIVLNTMIVGALVLVLALLQLSSLQRWEEGVEILCGLWLIAAPFTFGYGGALRTWHIVLGALVAVTGALELYQDWNRSDEELAHHGR